MLTACFFAVLAGALSAQAADIKTVHDDKGWRLQVDGEDFGVKGVVWSYVPIGENYTYDLWSQPEDLIYQVVDTDMTLLHALGINAIRVFSTVPARWIEYIYDRYGIWTMVNDLFGRYGLTVNGRWQFPTDYSDPETRKALLKQAQTTFETYKNTRGVLMYMLGNESNYGLEWTSAAIENLPGGERDEAKARALYSLFEEALALGKTIDPHRPMGLVNGDLGYLRLIQELVPSLDLLGVNTYRGAQSFNAFYNSIAKDLNKPFVYTELGADAFNVATGQEDQDDQAKLIAAQWREIYDQAYGKGKAANALGGFVFEWMDEWWKGGLETGLDVHDTKGTWNNGGYTFDSIPGVNNMNEEWFGLAGQSRQTRAGVPLRLPRTAYFLLQDLWKLDLYTSTKETVAKTFGSLNLESASRQGNSLALRDPSSVPAPALEVHGSLMARTDLKGDDQTWTAQGTSGLTAASQVSSRVGALLRTAEGLTGSFQFRFLPTDVLNNPAVDLNDPWESATKLTSLTKPVVPVELYQATVDYQSPLWNATAHYHDGHADWAQKGDLFTVLPESFDMVNPDRDNSKAPFGVEITAPGVLPGLTVYAGPELFWGARPAALVLYNAALPGGVTVSALHDEEFGAKATRLSSLSGSWQWPGIVSVDAGALLGRPEMVGNPNFTYQALQNDAVQTGLTFTWADALAGKLKIRTDAVPYLRLEGQYLWAGPLTDTHASIPREGSQLADVGLGNRQELQLTATAVVGDFTLRTTGLVRNPLYPAISKALYTVTRNPLSDVFTVGENRKAIQAESVLTWDRTGATYFHDWNNADREESPLSASLGFLYNAYLGPTDASTYINTSGVETAFLAGLPEVWGTWSAQARVAGRPFAGSRLNLTATAGTLQSTGISSRLTTFESAQGQFVWGQSLIEASYSKDAWGPYGWHRQFNLTYPTQAMVGVALGLKPLSLLTDTDRIGFRWTYREYGPYSSNDEIQSGLKNRFAAELYAGWSF